MNATRVNQVSMKPSKTKLLIMNKNKPIKRPIVKNENKHSTAKDEYCNNEYKHPTVKNESCNNEFSKKE